MSRPWNEGNPTDYFDQLDPEHEKWRKQDFKMLLFCALCLFIVWLTRFLWL